jgi:hypothetical protein
VLPVWLAQTYFIFILDTKDGLQSNLGNILTHQKALFITLNSGRSLGIIMLVFERDMLVFAAEFIRSILAYFSTQLTQKATHIWGKIPFLFKSFHRGLMSKMGKTKATQTRYTFAP